MTSSAANYRTALVPNSPGVWVDVCNDCGSMVLDRGAHDRFHESLRSVR